MKIISSILLGLTLSSCSTGNCKFYGLDDIPGHAEPNKVKDVNKERGYCLAPEDEKIEEVTTENYFRSEQCDLESEEVNLEASNILIGIAYNIDLNQQRYVNGELLSFNIELYKWECSFELLKKGLKEHKIELQVFIELIEGNQYKVSFKKLNKNQ